MQYRAFDLQRIDDYSIDDQGQEIAVANPGRLCLYVEYLSGSQIIQLNINDQSSTTVGLKGLDSWPSLPIAVNSVYTPLLAQQSWRAVAATGQTISVRVWEVVERPLT